VLDDVGLTIDLHAASDFADVDVGGGAVADLLGRRTAELHRSLARPGGPAQMRPEGFTLLWQRSVLQTLRNAIKSTQRELHRARRAGRLPADVDIDRLDGRVDDLVERFDRLRTTKFDAQRIRIHGDLHLGQVLWTGTDVVFIDFEGEPGAPMAQRSIKRSPLADVAGLVRSFDYAGRMAVQRAVERGRIGDSEQRAVDSWRRRWTHGVTTRLLDSYFAAIDDAGLIPAADDDRRLLLDVYMLVKAMYEVRYELSNRPDWVGWPIAAIVERCSVTRRHDRRGPVHTGGRTRRAVRLPRRRRATSSSRPGGARRGGGVARGRPCSRRRHPARRAAVALVHTRATADRCHGRCGLGAGRRAADRVGLAPKR
jgi:trehalose synthase-fused probable maltokinase